MSVRKRTRFTEPRFFRGPKRQVEKKQTNLAVTITGSAQDDTVLMTVVDPVTVGGFIWDLNSTAVTDPASGPGYAYWAIVVVREGVTVGTLGVANGSPPYQPEENCIVAAGVNVGDIGLGTAIGHQHQGRSKTMRKLKGGDTVHFIMRGSQATQVMTTIGVVTFFAKH